jgi:hypothetical protein
MTRTGKDRVDSQGFLEKSSTTISKPVVEEKKNDGPKRPTFCKEVKKIDGKGGMTRAGYRITAF